MAQPLKALHPGETSPPRRPALSPRPQSNRLWIAVHLPVFPLEALARRSGLATRTPAAQVQVAVDTPAAAVHAGAAAVVEPQKGHLRVVVANDTALDQGVSPGLKLNAAQARSPALAVLNRSAEVEHRELVSLACWVRRITPQVSLEPPQALVLEVGGSLKLWGGLDSIRETLDRELGRRRLTAHLCTAPTALAALWLARDGHEDVLSAKQLAGRLGALPLRVTGWPQAVRRLLKKMGAGTVGDCLRLPRDGLIRRVGQRYLDDLDRSLGQQQDLRTAFSPDRRFSSIVEFQEEVAEPQVIADAGKKLILRLAEALHRHQAQIASCRYGFRHLHRPATEVRINQVVPTYEPQKIIDLFLSRLETLSLPAPVTALSLTTGKTTPMTGLNSTLFPACPEIAPETTLGELIARLRTRLGAEDIHGLGLAEDHRPEAAWRQVKDHRAEGGRNKVKDHRAGVAGNQGKNLRAGPVASKDASGHPQRPLWLLPAPVSVAGADGGRKHLELESGPERVEAGWWEGRDTCRDYYVARGSMGMRLWVFRDRRSDRGDWYLHGIFG